MLFLILKTLLRVLACSLLLLLLKIQVEFKLIVSNDKYISFVYIYFLNIFRLRMNFDINPDKNKLISLSLNKKESNEKSKNSFEQALKYGKKMLSFYKSNAKHISFLKKKVKINDFNMLTRIGTGDAATTALCVGSINAFYPVLYRYLTEHYYFQKIKLNVFPYFRGPLFDLYLNCIINFKIGHIIIAALRILMKK